jgi:membrane-associated phospholipid phosphatase
MFTAAGGLVFGYDHWIEGKTPHTHTRYMTRLAKGIGRAGEGGYEGGLLAACLAGGLLTKNDEFTKTTILAGESFLIANAAGTALKVAVGRSRPYVEEGPFKLRPVSAKTSRNSFPSGHTVSAFSLASVFSARSDSLWVSYTVYGAASLVAVQRVYTRRHWVSDVAAGAFIGTYVGRRVARSAASAKKPVVWVIPEFSPAGGYAGLRAAYSF